jgi:hypothetical protein
VLKILFAGWSKRFNCQRAKTRSFDFAHDNLPAYIPESLRMGGAKHTHRRLSKATERTLREPQDERDETGTVHDLPFMLRAVEASTACK